MARSLSPQHRAAVAESLRVEVKAYVDEHGVRWRHCRHCTIFTSATDRRCPRCKRERAGERSTPTEVLMLRARGIGGYGLAAALPAFDRA